MSKMGSHCSFEHLKHNLWAKEGRGVKLAVWLLTIKSRESTSSRHPIWECDTTLESSRRELKLWCWEIWASKVPGLQPRTVSGLQLRSPWKNNQLDVISVVSCRIYYKGEGGGCPQVRAVVNLVCPCCPWLVLAPKVFQLCTNHFVWVVCRPVWVSEACQLFLVPSRSSNTPLYPSKCCELGSGSKFQLLPHCRILGPSSGSTRNLGARHPLQVTLCTFFLNLKPHPPFGIMPFEYKFQLWTITQNGAKQETFPTTNVHCGIITTYKLHLQFTSSDSNDENLKAKETYGGERKKNEMLTLENETRRWIVMAKFPKSNNASGATLVMERNVFENLRGNE